MWFNSTLFYTLLDVTWKVWLGSGAVLAICLIAMVVTMWWSRGGL